MLTAGSVVILTSLQDQLHLSLSEEQESNKVIGCAELSPNAHWTVEVVQTTLSNKEQVSSQVILLSNPVFTQNLKKSHLRVAASGKVDHKGANGNWARFAVEYVGNDQVKLRCIGRSNHHTDRCLLGIVKHGSCYEAVGDLTDDAPEARFCVQYVSKL